MSTIGQRQLFFEHVGQTTTAPFALEVERAEGIYLYSPDGKKTMDLISGISVCNLGHSHPAIVEAVKTQAEKYMHLMVYGEIIQSPQVELAKKLADMLPDGLDMTYFVGSGSEATEGSLKLAKRVTGRPKLVACNKAYHGSTHGALSVLGDDYFKQAFRPLLPEVYFIDFNDPDQLSIIDERTAGVIMEPIQGEGGLNIPDASYLQAVRKRCDETGALLIFDEVQTGFGRTGKMFGFEHSGVVPDIINFAKGIGGGMPLGAFVASKERMMSFTNNPILGHITTFGGHPVSCAAGLAMLNELEKHPELIATAQAKGEIIKSRLKDHPMAKDVRGIGLFYGIELESSEMREKVVALAKDRGVMLDPFLFREDCMRMAPPLTITEEQLNEACDIIISVFDDLGK